MGLSPQAYTPADSGVETLIQNVQNPAIENADVFANPSNVLHCEMSADNSSPSLSPSNSVRVEDQDREEKHEDEQWGEDDRGREKLCASRLGIVGVRCVSRRTRDWIGGATRKAVGNEVGGAGSYYLGKWEPERTILSAMSVFSAPAWPTNFDTE
ncbi:hypothetical protein K438DRAFT_1784441 [Mycena galopus ATCC 62051]|nr:hypothetical protein K438DRAFT_1784441 [Mycena galopus ATCC 62051]